MSNPYIIGLRAASEHDLERVFHSIDAGRLEYLAEVLAAAGRAETAAQASLWALEHRQAEQRAIGRGQVSA